MKKCTKTRLPFISISSSNERRLQRHKTSKMWNRILITRWSKSLPKANSLIRASCCHSEAIRTLQRVDMEKLVRFSYFKNTVLRILKSKVLASQTWERSRILEFEDCNSPTLVMLGYFHKHSLFPSPLALKPWPLSISLWCLFHSSPQICTKHHWHKESEIPSWTGI